MESVKVPSPKNGSGLLLNSSSSQSTSTSPIDALSENHFASSVHKPENNDVEPAVTYLIPRKDQTLPVKVCIDSYSPTMNTIVLACQQCGLICSQGSPGKNLPPLQTKLTFVRLDLLQQFEGQTCLDVMVFF